jgi:predicted amidophosphoribosyltransferase
MPTPDPAGPDPLVSFSPARERLPGPVLARSAALARFLRSPFPPGPGVCSVCLTPTGVFDRCLPCQRGPRVADGVLAISYSLHGSPLHAALREYKRDAGPGAHRLRVDLAALLWRFLALHERCLASVAGVPGFDLVTAVPSLDPRPPLQAIIAAIAPTAARHRLLLARRPGDVEVRRPDPQMFAPRTALAGEAVLLIDDTWTTGSTAQSAALALKRAGARAVGVAVIGRHIHAEFRDNRRLLDRVRGRFAWSSCALCAAE